MYMYLLYAFLIRKIHSYIETPKFILNLLIGRVRPTPLYERGAKKDALVQDRTGDLRMSILLPRMSYLKDMRPTS